MDNPESLGARIDPHTMYEYSMHRNISWNITEYKPRREYLDPYQLIREKKIASGGDKNKSTKKATKRGFYMDYDLKVAKGIPSPHDHNQQKMWETEKLKKFSQRRKVDLSLKKNTYIEQIETQQLKRKSPGISTYKLYKSMKEIEADLYKIKKKKQSVGEKFYFYQNTEALSDRVPGVGHYCPRVPYSKLHANKTDCKFWVNKHTKESSASIEKEKNKPAVGTYNPMNVTMPTFDTIAKESSHPKYTKIEYFGKDARFYYTRPAKKTIVETRPDPSSYKTMIYWKGKRESPKKSSWNEMVWKGYALTHTSAYH